MALMGKSKVESLKSYDKSKATAYNLGQIGAKHGDARRAASDDCPDGQCRSRMRRQARATEVCSKHIAGSDGEAEPHGVARRATSDDCPDGQCRSRMRRQDGLKCKQLLEQGQAAVEYLLLIAAMAAVIFSLMNYLKTEILGNQANCAAGERSLGCSLQRISDTLGASDPNFRFFRLKR